MFGIGPTWLFVFEQRLPVGMMKDGMTPWLSTMATSVAIAFAVAFTAWFVGLGAFLVVHLPIVILAGSIGIWLFYVQHQFEETEWAREPDWEFQHAALYGSSYYDLPALLSWFTGNIGIHHVHHLSAKVPHYRLPEVLRDHPELKTIGRITLMQSFRFVKLALWDETRGKLVTFREAHAAG
jgi:omega-6 fatty acid desaturase (delta-12 desaturase)